MRGRRNPTATLLLFALFPLLAASQRADFAHVTQNAFPLLALLPAAIVSAPARRAGLRLAAVFVAAMSLAALTTLPARWPDDIVRAEIVQAARSACAGSDYLYAGPFLPHLYFETNKLDPTRHSVLLTGYNTPAQCDAAARALASAAPPCALTNYDLVAKFGYTRDNPVDRYLAAHYTAVRTWPDGLVLWRLRREGTAGDQR